jgi:hypothetical protein
VQPEGAQHSDEKLEVATEIDIQAKRTVAIGAGGLSDL